MRQLFVAIRYLFSQIAEAWRNACALATGRITIEEIEDDCIGRCECCSAVHPFEEMYGNADGNYFCRSCVAKWQEAA